MNDSGLLRLDGLDGAVVGHTCNLGHPVLVYDMDKIIEVLEQEQGLEHHEASEYFWLHVAGAYFGPDTPVIICQDEGDYFQHEINNERP